MSASSTLLVLGSIVAFANAVTYNNYGRLPKFLTNNPLPQGYPWGTANTTNTNPEYGPNTGVMRFYDLTVSRATISPDGYSRPGILINDQFPGPLLEANWGDTLHITVHNGIKDEGTALHWHGQPQRLTPEYDGVPTVQQCPIAPGKSFTYIFKAEQYGSSWYHSHFSSQYMDGAFGPMVIYGPRSEKFDEDLGVVLLNDYYHADYYNSTFRAMQVPPTFDRSQNNFINGKMDVACLTSTNATSPPSPPNTTNPTGPTVSETRACDQSKLAQFNFEPGKTYLLRVVNTGVTVAQKFQIDQHDLTIIASDYVPTVPYTTKVITLGVGQRADVLVKANGKPKTKYWMRSDLDATCMYLNTAQPRALAVVSYPGAPAAPPKTNGKTWASNNCRNDPLNSTQPQYVIKPPRTVEKTLEVSINTYPNESGVILFNMMWGKHNSTFKGNYNHPVYLLAKAGNTSYPDDPQWNVYNFKQAKSIRVILYNYFFMPHPVHLHGHNYWVLQEGQGKWDGSVVNAQNPMRRDVQLIQPGAPDNPGYLVLQWEADNPGVWPLHCHIASDVALGLYMSVMERPDLIQKNRKVPATSVETCRNWWRFSGHEFVNQIDSGV